MVDLARTVDRKLFRRRLGKFLGHHLAIDKLHGDNRVPLRPFGHGSRKHRNLQAGGLAGRSQETLHFFLGHAQLDLVEIFLADLGGQPARPATNRATSTKRPSPRRLTNFEQIRTAAILRSGINSLNYRLTCRGFTWQVILTSASAMLAARRLIRDMSSSSPHTDFVR